VRDGTQGDGCDTLYVWPPNAKWEDSWILMKTQFQVVLCSSCEDGLRTAVEASLHEFWPKGLPEGRRF